MGNKVGMGMGTGKRTLVVINEDLPGKDGPWNYFRLYEAVSSKL